MNIDMNKRIKLGPILSIVFLVTSCISNRGGGTIPIFIDEFVETTAERRVEIKTELEGHIIKYQKAYDCNHEFYKYNATAIISTHSELITIYDYCQQQDFKPGDKVRISHPQKVNSEWSVREIYEPLPQSSGKHGYWYCVSCKYKNAFGQIQLIKEH